MGNYGGIFMNENKKYGFVYIWYDRKHKRYYIGCHWGNQNDGYVCSSSWMNQAYRIRPQDFKRRIIKTNILSRADTYIEEQKYLDMIKPEELKTRYYNLHIKVGDVWQKYDEHIKTVGQKISKTKKGKIFTEEHKQVLRGKKKPHTEEWKQQNSERLKEQWESGIRQSFGPMKKEHKNKISESLTGLKREDVINYKISHSKSYIIYYENGDELEIHGLKKFSEENNIPYVTLHKAFINQTSIKKYNINKIKEAV
jgi:uncharacterized CHY-type Zn-finger protein